MLSSSQYIYSNTWHNNSHGTVPISIMAKLHENSNSLNSYGSGGYKQSYTLTCLSTQAIVHGHSGMQTHAQTYTRYSAKWKLNSLKKQCIYHIRICCDNSFPPGEHVYVCELDQHWFRQWLLAYSAASHYLNPCSLIVMWTPKNERTSVTFKSKYRTFNPRKCIWICRLRNGGYFVQGKMS